MAFSLDHTKNDSNHVVDNFEDLFNATVTASIGGMLGESAAQAIIYYLHMDGNFAKAPNMFHARLYELLKDPAYIIEEIVLKAIFAKLGLQFVRPEEGRLEFADHVAKARAIFAENQKRQKARKRRE